MKKLIWILGAVLALGMGFIGCSGDSGGDDNGAETDVSVSKTVDSSLADVASGYIRINCEFSNASILWIWDDFAESEKDKANDWNTGGISVKGSNGDFKYFDIQLADAPKQLSFIVKSGVGDKKLTEDLIFNFPVKYKEIFVLADSSIWIAGGNADDNGKIKLYKPSGILSGTIISASGISLNGSRVNLTNSNTVVKNGETSLTITGISGLNITVSENLSTIGMVTVEYTDDLGTDTITAVPSDELLDEWFDLDETQFEKLGYKNGVFTTWAPLASSVSIQLFDNASNANAGAPVAVVIPMTRGAKGLWTTEDVSSTVGSNKYYKYLIHNGSYDYSVCDIWAKVASKDSKATQIVDINDSSAKPIDWKNSYKNPFGNSGTDTKNYTDAIIYEMHITDWSRGVAGTSVGLGGFSDITTALAQPDGTLYKHLKDLGITHVQILPMFEYDVVKDDDAGYNWGYNPYNWNTPESRYAKLTTSSDGTDAVKAMREMIKAFHDAGISVIMDVVYNHTMGTKNGSIYDMTIPKYFYRTNGDVYSNGSGCGNETATNHAMVKKYVIDSLKHWMNDYHINGFRFDLMGVHEKSTMKDIYDALYEIDKNVMVYGEPWTGGTSAVVDGATSATKGTNGFGAGAFDDDFRDAIKGAEFGGFKFGHVQGNYNDTNVNAGLTGKVISSNRRNATGLPGLALHYAECHDNYTLADKLWYSTLGDDVKDKDDIVSKFPASLSSENLNLVKAQEKLVAAYILLSQGTPFLNGGQEFMRTKKGNPDSYAADKKGGKTWTEDEILECNTVDLEFKTTYSDVYSVYKGLIALRKDNPTAFGANTSARAVSVKDAKTNKTVKGIVKYSTEGFVIYFNPTETDYDFFTVAPISYTNSSILDTTLASAKLVTISTGAVQESSSLPNNINAHSFVIFKN